jgi:hypothetical protein
VADGVSEELTEGLGDALFDLAGRTLKGVGRGLHDVVDWARDAIEPPPGLELIAADGTRYSGIFVLERGNVVAMIAVPVVPAGASRPVQPPIHARPYPEDLDWAPGLR